VPAVRSANMAPRILIITASVGAGHELPAQSLAAQFAREVPESVVMIEDGLDYLGPVVSTVSHRAPKVVFFRSEWIWDAGFWLFATFPPTRWLSQHGLYRIERPRLRTLIERANPDVVISTWPITTEVLGRMRRRGEIPVPVVSTITDISALRYWAVPGVDLHLISYPQAEREVRRIAGPATRIVCVHGMTRPEFLEERSRIEARRLLDLPEDAAIVLVSGGGWGVGDVAGAIDVARSVAAVDVIVCLCGRNGELAAGLRARLGDDPRVRIEGFTDRIADYMAAANALVHSTGGNTIIEAHMRGCTPISYGWGRGHIRMHNNAFRRFGIADVVTTQPELAGAIRRAVASSRTPDTSFARLPSAAATVMDLIGALPVATSRSIAADR
jgi:processive 1,2-diacylglycerol beta-glucosyltransferase